MRIIDIQHYTEVKENGKQNETTAATNHHYHQQQHNYRRREIIFVKIRGRLGQIKLACLSVSELCH